MTDDENGSSPPPGKEPIKVSFSLPQIVGGALAAATAAALGAQIGVAGTILGAAVASIIGGIGGTLYSAGLDRTHRRVTDAIQRGYDKVRDGGTGSASDVTEVLPVFSDDPETLVDQPRVPAAGDEAAKGPIWRRTFFKRMAITIGAMFVLALVAVTAIELGLGRSLDGSGDTTVGQVVRPRATPTTSPSATPSVTPSLTPTPSAPSITPTATPTPVITPTPTVTPTPVPTQTVTVLPTATGS